MIYVRNNISILTFEWIPIIEVCLQQEIRKNIHILKVPLTIVPDQVPKKWVSEVSWGKGLWKVDQGISSFLAKFLA